MSLLYGFFDFKALCTICTLKVRIIYISVMCVNGTSDKWQLKRVLELYTVTYEIYI